jgi:hypothetical protein
VSELDPFRYCVYCAADCYEDEPQHKSDCPSITGLFPIRENDLGPKCGNCGYQPGMCCGKCHTPFAIGDFYVNREMGAATQEIGAPFPARDISDARIYEVLCVGCGAQAEEGEA